MTRSELDAWVNSIQIQGELSKYVDIKVQDPRDEGSPTLRWVGSLWVSVHFDNESPEGIKTGRSIQVFESATTKELKGQLQYAIQNCMTSAFAYSTTIDNQSWTSYEY